MAARLAKYNISDANTLMYIAQRPIQITLTIKNLEFYVNGTEVKIKFNKNTYTIEIEKEYKKGKDSEYKEEKGSKYEDKKNGVGKDEEKKDKAKSDYKEEKEKKSNTKKDEKEDKKSEEDRDKKGK